MKKLIILVCLTVFLFTSCSVVADAKKNANQAQYRSITGKDGTIIKHKLSGDEIIGNGHIDYVGVDNDDLFYTTSDGKSHYYSGSCSFDF